MKAADDAGAVRWVRGDGKREGSRGAEGFLDEVGKGPHAADEADIRSFIDRGTVGGVLDLAIGQVFNFDVGVCGCRWKFEDDGEKGILEEHGLPEFAALLLIERADFRRDNGRVPIEAHGVGLTDQYASESPCVAGMIVVHQKIGYKDHGLDCAHCGLAQVGRHA